MPSQTYQQLLEELKQTGIYEKSTDADIMDAYMEVLDVFIKTQLQNGEDPRTIAEGLNLHCQITKPEAHEYVQMVVKEVYPERDHGKRDVSTDWIPSKYSVPIVIGAVIAAFWIVQVLVK